MAKTDRIEAHTASQQTESISEKLYRECELIGSSPVYAAKGAYDYAAATFSSKENMLNLGAEVATAALVATGVGVMAQRGGFVGMIGRAAPEAFALLAAADIGSRVLPPAYSAWQSADNLKLAKEQLGANLGAAVVDYTLMGVAAHAGFRYGARAYQSSLDRIEFGPRENVSIAESPIKRLAPPPLNYSNLGTGMDPFGLKSNFGVQQRSVSVGLPKYISVAGATIAASDLIGK